MSKEYYTHIAWGCRACNKIDWVDDNEAKAMPEHIPYRGMDIGKCKGKMIKLYSLNEGK